MTPAEKAKLDAAIAKIDELEAYLRTSLPLRATGGGHLFNSLLTVNKDLKNVQSTVVVA